MILLKPSPFNLVPEMTKIVFGIVLLLNIDNNLECMRFDEMFHKFLVQY